jgi:DNA-binding response OmpR family regulator
VLTEPGDSADSAHDGEEGFDFASMAENDDMVLDLMLSKLSGLLLLRSNRNKRIKTPLLTLTVRDGIEYRVKGPNAGADDCPVIPFGFLELLA